MKSSRQTSNIARLTLAAVAAATFMIVAPGRGSVAQAATGLTERVSIDNNESEVAGGSRFAAVSASGRFIAFESDAAIDPGDTNGLTDIYVRDRDGGATYWVSQRDIGGPANSASSRPSISADGSTVVYSSFATNMVSGDTNGAADVFVTDLNANVQVLSKLGATFGNGNSVSPAISADGNAVAFVSNATNLGVPDSNAVADIYVLNRSAGTFAIASYSGSFTQSTLASNIPAISADGRFVTFQTFASLDPADTNGVMDVYRRNMAASSTLLVSASGGAAGNGASQSASLSSDGRYVAFQTVATNLSPEDPDEKSDVLVADTTNGSFVLASSRDAGGVSVDIAGVFDAAISPDGRFVAFSSDADDLVFSDTNATRDVFVRDLANRTTSLASIHTNGGQSSGLSSVPSISYNGEVVAFQSTGSDLVGGDANGAQDIFVHHRPNFTNFAWPSIAVASQTSAGDGAFASSTQTTVSADGRWVAFVSGAQNLVHGDTNFVDDVFVRNRITGKTVRVSVGTDGFQDDGDSADPSISADGRFVAFSSDVSFDSADLNAARDIYLRDRDADGDGIFDEPGQVQTTLVSKNSVGAAANGNSDSPSISDDGSRIAFASTATNLVSDSDLNTQNDVFVVDFTSIPVITLLSKRTALDQSGNGNSSEPAISGDGSTVAFTSFANDLVASDTNGDLDVFVSTVAGPVTRVSVSTAGAEANEDSYLPTISRTGRHVGFVSIASNIGGPDVPFVADAFARDRDTDGDNVFDEAGNVATTKLSLTISGAAAGSSVGDASLSANGRYIAFTTSDDLLDGADADAGSPDVYIRDRDPDVDGILDESLTSGLRLASLTATGSNVGGSAGFPGLSADGRILVFRTNATLALDDDNELTDAYVKDLATNPTDRMNVDLGGAEANVSTVINPRTQAISSDGRFVVFQSQATNLHPLATDGQNHIFLRDRMTGEVDLIDQSTSGALANDDSSLPLVSDDGRYVAFSSFGSNLVSPSFAGLDVFLRDRLTRTTSLVSRSASGGAADGFSQAQDMTPDASRIVFKSTATNLIDFGSDTADPDLFIYYRGSESIGPVWNQADNVVAITEALDAAIDDSGDFIAFSSASGAFADEDGLRRNIFLVQLQSEAADTIRRITRGPGGAQIDSNADRPAISDFGDVVAYDSTATNLVTGDTNGQRDVFIYNRSDQTTARVSLDDADNQATGGPSQYPSISGDGRLVAFNTSASFVPNSTVVVRDRGLLTTRIAAKTWDGRPGVVVSSTDFSRNGRVLAFPSLSDYLAFDRNGFNDVFIAEIPPAPPVPVADVTNLNITADTANIGAGIGSIPLASIPIESIPVLSDQMADTKIGDVDMASTPIASIPIASIGLDLATLDPEALDSILLSSIPLDWDQILAGTQFAGLNRNSISLKMVFDNPSAKARFLQAAQSVEIGEFGFAQNLLRGTSVVAAMLGSTPIASIPPPGGAPSWCAVLQAAGFSCDGVTGQTTLLSLDIAGAPIASIPIASIPIASIPIASIPIASIPIVSIPLLGPIASIPIASIATPSEVVDCSRIDCSQAGGKVLRDAKNANPTAIRQGATLADLAGAFGDITLGQVIVELLARSDFPWEIVPPDSLLASGQGGTVGYTVSYDFTCTDPLVMTHKVTVPQGFQMVSGSARITYNDAGATTIADPSRTGNVLTFDGLPGNPCGPGSSEEVLVPTVNVKLRFRARPSFAIGPHSAAVEVIENGFSFTKTGASVNVTEHFEPNDTAETAAVIPTDTLIFGHVSSSDDEDIYRVNLPAGRQRVYASLYNIQSGEDFDLLAYSPQPPPLQSTPIASIPIASIPIEDRGADFRRGDEAAPPETLADVPIASIPLLGPIASISANRSNTIERTEFVSSGGATYFRVRGYNGSYSTSTPYVLRVWTFGAPPLPVAPPRVLPNDQDPWNGQDEAGSRGSLPGSTPADRETLFIVNQDRLNDLYGRNVTTEMLAAMNAVAARPDVRGTVLPVDGDPDVRAAFARWDANPNDVVAANDIVRAINNVITRYRTALPNLKYIVIGGTDEVIPFARELDETTLSNEIDQAANLAFTTDNLTKSNAAYGSAAQGMILTDQAYGTLTRTPWRGRELFIPDLSVSRLVETPQQITAQLRRYIAANGLINPTTALVTGYDFLTDGAEATRDELTARFPAGMRTLINDTWDRDALIAEFTGRSPAPDVVALNAHYSYRLAQPPAATTAAGMFSTADVPDPPSGPLDVPPLALRVIFTVGCHGGLNVADTAPSVPASAVLLKDWAQTWAGQQGAVYIGNTGFGYGDSEISALSERLYTYFAHYLRDDRLTMGQKWVSAIHRYFRTAGTYGPYDAKVMIEGTMYGLPFYRASGAGTLPPSTPPVTTVDPVTGLQTATISSTPTLTRVDTDRGSYWKGPSGTHDKHFRPVQPVETREVAVPAAGSAHGVRITALTTVDVPGVDPFLSRPSIDLAGHEGELGAPDQIYPAHAAHLQRSRMFGSESATLTLIAGQFRPSDPVLATGTQRLITSATMQVAYSNSNDFTTPLIHEMHVVATGPTSAKIVLRASDESAGGVKRVGALYRVGTANTWTYVELVRDGSLWVADVTAPGPMAGDLTIEALGQAQDEAGNVATTTNKGFLHPAESDAAGPSIVIRSPLAGATYAQHAAVRADFACSDDAGVASCIGTVADGALIDTSSIGQKSFTVNARDAVGNVASRVVRYIVTTGGQPPVIDTIKPVTQFRAGDDILIYLPPVRADTVGGRTTDNLSGVDFVTVTYRPLIGGQAFTTKPSLTCDAPRRTCVWKAAIPSVPGQYRVTAFATDKAGNVESPGPSRTFLLL